jgi:hypothetical protein
MTRSQFIAAVSAVVVTAACVSGCQWFQREAVPPVERPTGVRLKGPYLCGHRRQADGQ